MRRILALVVALTVIVGSTAIASAATPGAGIESATQVLDRLSDRLSSVPDSGTLDAPVLVVGSVVQGRRVVRRGTAWVELWPTEEVEKTIPDGTPFNKALVARAKVDRSGRFVLRLDRDAIPADYMADDGQIDAVVTVTDGDRLTTFVFSATPSEVSDRWVRSGGDEAVRREAGSPELVLDVGDPAKSRDVADDRALRVSDAGTQRYWCWDVFGTPSSPQWAYIGEVNAGPGVSGQFTYQAYGKTTLGVGYSYTGAYGSFRAAGSLSKSTTSTMIFPKVYGDQNYRTMYRYRMTWQQCRELYPDGGYEDWTQNYYNKPYSWYGGAQALWKGDVSMRYCSSYLAGSVWTTESQRGTYFRSGITVFGTGLFTRTNYSSKVKTRFDFNRPGYMCGNDFDGLSSSSRFSART